MKLPFLRLGLLVAAPLCLLSCAGLKVPGFKAVEVGEDGETPAQESTARGRGVGVVETVYPEQRFVLIRRTTGLLPEEGAHLIAEGGGPPSELVASSHRKGSFFSADIEDGTPRIGDSVRLLTGGQSEPESENLTLPDRAEWHARGAGIAADPLAGESAGRLDRPDEDDGVDEALRNPRGRGAEERSVRYGPMSGSGKPGETLVLEEAASGAPLDAGSIPADLPPVNGGSVIPELMPPPSLDALPDFGPPPPTNTPGLPELKPPPPAN